MVKIVQEKPLLEYHSLALKFLLKMCIRQKAFHASYAKILPIMLA